MQSGWARRCRRLGEALQAAGRGRSLLGAALACSSVVFCSNNEIHLMQNLFRDEFYEAAFR